MEKDYFKLFEEQYNKTFYEPCIKEDFILYLIFKIYQKEIRPLITDELSLQFLDESSDVLYDMLGNDLYRRDYSYNDFVDIEEFDYKKELYNLLFEKGNRYSMKEDFKEECHPLVYFALTKLKSHGGELLIDSYRVPALSGFLFEIPSSVLSLADTYLNASCSKKKVREKLVYEYLFHGEIPKVNIRGNDSKPVWPEKTFGLIFADTYTSKETELYNQLDTNGTMLVPTSLEGLASLMPYLKERKIRSVFEIKYPMDEYGDYIRYLVEITKQPNSKIQFISNVTLEKDNTRNDEIIYEIERGNSSYVKDFPTDKVIEMGTIDPYFYFTDAFFEEDRITLGDIAQIMPTSQEDCDCSNVETFHLRSTVQGDFILKNYKRHEPRELTKIDRPSVIFDHLSYGILGVKPTTEVLKFDDEPDEDTGRFVETFVETPLMTLSTRIDDDSILCKNGYQQPGIYQFFSYENEFGETYYYDHAPMSNEYLKYLLLDPDTQRQVESFNRRGWKNDDILSVRIPNRSKEEIEQYIEKRKHQEQVAEDSENKKIIILALGDKKFCKSLQKSFEEDRFVIVPCKELEELNKKVKNTLEDKDTIFCDISDWENTDIMYRLMEIKNLSGIEVELFAKSCESECFRKIEELENSKRGWRLVMEDLRSYNPVYILSEQDKIKEELHQRLIEKGIKPEIRDITERYEKALSVLEGYQNEQKTLKKILGSIHYPKFPSYAITEPLKEYTPLRKILEDVCRILNKKKYLPDQFIPNDYVSLGNALNYLYGHEVTLNDKETVQYGNGVEEGDWVISPSVAKVLSIIQDVVNKESHTYSDENTFKDSKIALQGYALLLSEVLRQIPPSKEPKAPTKPVWVRILEGKKNPVESTLQCDDKRKDIYWTELSFQDENGDPEPPVTCYVRNAKKLSALVGETYTFTNFKKNEVRNQYKLSCEILVKNKN